MGRRERITELMPRIAQIQDEKLRKAVVDVWVKAWEDSEWEDVCLCPMAPFLECSLIDHTNWVTNIALAMASYAQAKMKIAVDNDILIAGAVLHDVSELVEYSPERGKPGKMSPLGDALIHTAYGVHLALNAGIPLKVAEVIGTHTPEVSRTPKCVEGIFVTYADLSHADVMLLQSDLPLVMKAVKLNSIFR